MGDTQQPGRKKAFIYCRTSADSEKDDGKKVSIEEQIESGKKLAQQHDYEIIGPPWIDRNRSGRLYPTGFEIPDLEVDAYCSEIRLPTSNRTRNAFGTMMSRIGEVSVIIVRNADRLMRPLPLSKLDGHILAILKYAHVLIHSHDDSIINPSDPQHVLIFKMTATVSSGFVTARQTETKKALHKLRNEGKLYFSPTFYGFKSTRIPQGVERVPGDIVIIQRIFREFLDGGTLKGIARGLNLEGIPTRPSHGQHKRHEDGTPKQTYWTDSTIRSILQRTQYAAYQLKTNGVEEVLTPAFLPPVIDPQIFKRVKGILDQKRKYPRTIGNSIHALGGLVFCGHCHYHLYTTATYIKFKGRKVKVDYFQCRKAIDTGGQTGCGNAVSIRERSPKGFPAENSALYITGLEECLFPLIYKGYINHLIAQKRRVGLDDEIADLKERISTNDLFKTKLGAKLRRKELSDKDFDLLLKEPIDLGNKMEEQLAQLQKEADSIQRAEIPTAMFEDFANHSISDEIKRMLFHSAIDHVDVWPEKITVHLKPDGAFTLKRVKVGVSWVLPSWDVVPTNIESALTTDDLDIHRITYKRLPIDERTQFHVIYKYDTNDDLDLAYGNHNIIVFTAGKKAMKFRLQEIVERRGRQ